MAYFCHCTFYKLNFNINDQNTIPNIKNITSTIKDIILFFRESVLRRNVILNKPTLHKTRWSEKMFSKYFVEIKTAFGTLTIYKN